MVTLEGTISPGDKIVYGFLMFFSGFYNHGKYLSEIVIPFFRLPKYLEEQVPRANVHRWESYF